MDRPIFICFLGMIVDHVVELAVYGFGDESNIRYGLCDSKTGSSGVEMIELIFIIASRVYIE